MCAQGDRREFITRIRRIAADIDRSYQQASLDSLEDMTMRVNDALRQTLVAFPEEGDDGDSLLTLLQRIKVSIRSRIESLEADHRFQVGTGKVQLNYAFHILI